MLKYSLIGIPFLVLYIIFSSMISTTEWIWYLTRVFGLVSFFFLFVTIMLGELRLLSFVKGNFKLFKYHIPIAIFTVALVVLHFISAAFDKFKWGKTLAFSQFLGFSFSDKWLTFLSLGAIAFYLLILVSMTSMRPAMRSLGFKKWKLVHLFSYLSFIFAYIHSVNLGTDIKTSVLSVLLKPAVMFCFWIVIAILLVRILKSFDLFTDQAEVNLTTAFFVVLIVGGVFVISVFFSVILDSPENPSVNIENISADLAYYENANNLLINQNAVLESELMNYGGVTNATSS